MYSLRFTEQFLFQKFQKIFFQVFIGMKLDSKIKIYYNSATSPMKKGNTGQRRKLSILHKKPAKQTSSSPPLAG